ncbi:hypothetical protein BC940DRAFT_349615 [Gongronella butleri]|nr:hypothetical protein BC940DRAFT_349615 [Gongronella butleri]
MSTAAFGYTARPKTIEVPLQHEQVLEVVCNDLPVIPTELTDIFSQEKVPLTYYRALAIEYYEQGKMEESMTVIQAGLTIASKSPTTQPREKLPLLTLLATVQMRQAKESGNNDLLAAASQTLNEADRIHSQYEQSIVIKGHLHLLRKDTKEAARCFDMVLDRRANCLPALIAKAKLKFQAKDYKMALKTYQQALLFAVHDAAAAEVRLGIAQCYAHLSMIPEAKQALQLCISKNDATKASALLLLSILEQNESKSTTAGPAQQLAFLKSGLQHMQQAHAADTYNPVTLNLLSNFFFFVDDTEKALRASSKAFSHATNQSIQAEAAYQEARTQHKLKQYDEAFNHYRQCLQLNPDHLLAQFGIGQIHMQRGEYNLAREYYETILAAEPECIEALKILASIHVLLDNKDKALSLFNKVLSKSKQDADLLIDLAQLHEAKNPAQSLKYYQQALEALGDQQSATALRPQLLNNIGALYHRQGDLTQAATHYDQAIDACESSEPNQPNGAVAAEPAALDTKLTVTYNLGRLYEDQNDADRAIAVYTKIVDEYPTYADAHFRLGAIQQAKGHTAQAIENYKLVFDADENDAKAWIMIGGAQADAHDRTSKRSYEKVLKSCDKDDIYTHVALGNYHATSARELKSEKQSAQRQEAYKLAVNFYSQALKRDPKNAYAANGLAIVLAENNQIDLARDTFHQVLEAMPNNPCVWVNLAHVSVELKQHSQAIVMYENALRKFYDFKDANLLLCLARAQFLLGKNDKKPDVMYDALVNTNKALELQKDDKSIQYNVALVEQQYAQLVADLPVESRSSDKMRGAIQGLDHSQELFDALIKVPEGEHVYYDRKMAEQRRRYGDTLRTQMDRKMQEQLQYEEQRESKMRSVKLRQEEREAQKRAEIEERERKAQEERDRIEQDRRKLMEKVKEDNRLMSQRELEINDEEEERDAAKAAKRRKRKQKDMDNDIINDESEESDAETTKPPKKSKSAAVDDDSDDDTKAKRSNKKFRSKAIIEDSDDEDDE